LWFFLENDNLGSKMKILKFLGIQPNYYRFFTNLSRFSIFVAGWSDSLLLIIDFVVFVSAPSLRLSIRFSLSSMDWWPTYFISIGGSIGDSIEGFIGAIVFEGFESFWISDLDFFDRELFPMVELGFCRAVILLILVWEGLVIDVPGRWNSRLQLKHVKSCRQAPKYCDNKMQTFRRLHESKNILIKFWVDQCLSIEEVCYGGYPILVRKVFEGDLSCDDICMKIKF